MAGLSKIEWTEASWNPVTGCSKVSPGCLHCYAERMALRLQAMGNKTYCKGFQVATHEALLSVPERWRSPRMVFVNSMSDLFHEDVPEDFIHKVFSEMNRVDRHVFQVLTKRSKRLIEMAPRLDWTNNIWAGVTVESSDYLNRLDDLRTVPSSVRFVSFEPLLGSIENADLSGIDWVIVGGESGPGARPMQKEWVTPLRSACLSQGIPFFFKQWGGVNKKKAGRELDGRIWSQTPGSMVQ